MPTPNNNEPQTQPLPTFHLSSDMFLPEYGFEAWRQFIAPVMSVELPEPKYNNYKFDFTGYLSDQLVFGRGSYNKIWFNRGSAQSNTEASEQISLQFYTEGQAQGNLENGTPLVLRPDRIVLHDLAHPCTGIVSECNLLSAIIPRRLLKHHDLIYSQNPVLSWSITSPNGRLLKTVLETLYEEMPRLTLTDAATASAGLLGLLNGLLSSQWDEETRPAVEQVTLGAMQKYIQLNLHRPDLKVEDLCNEYYCSRATVYRIFSPCGGLMTYIRQQRLNRCFQILKKLSPDSQLSVKDLAARWGFTSPAHFSRLFKEQFDITPGELKSLLFQTQTNLQSSLEHDVSWLHRSLQ